MKCVVALFFPRLSMTKATVIFNFLLAIKATWPSGGWSAGILCDLEEPSSIFSLFSDR